MKLSFHQMMELTSFITSHLSPAPPPFWGSEQQPLGPLSPAPPPFWGSEQQPLGPLSAHSLPVRAVLLPPHVTSP